MKAVKKKFGSKGVMSGPDTCRHLDISPDTLRKRIKAKKIDARRDGGYLKVCRQSVEDYIANLDDAF